MELIGVITWIAVGIVTGWWVGQKVPMDIPMGFALGDAIMGMLGALFGGTLFNSIIEAGDPILSLWNILAAMSGAILMLFVLRAASEHGRAA